MDLSSAKGVTNKTIVDLSRAIGKRRLFKLRKFSLGFEKIGTSNTGPPLLTKSLAENGPELARKTLGYDDSRDEANGLKEVVLNSLREAGRTARVYVSPSMPLLRKKSSEKNEGFKVILRTLKTNARERN